MTNTQEEQTLVIMKPDAIQRALIGEVVGRFERKGLKIIGMKMIQVDELLVEKHYGQLKDKPFFDSIKEYITSAPVVVMVLEGINAINAVRLVAGPTAGHEADAGSIRGDLSMSVQANIVHASDSEEAAESEIKRFFEENELFSYERPDSPFVYSDTYFERRKR